MSRPAPPQAPQRVEPNRPVDADKPGADSPDGAWQFRRLQQQDENGHVPPDGLMRAKRQVDQMRRVQAMDPTMARSAGLSPAGWTWLGPGNVGGRVRSIVVNPVVPSTWFAGGVSGGIWKTVDSGAHWEPVNDFLSNLSIATIVIQPGNPSVMYAGTGEFAQSLQGAGIFKSTDGGETWAQLPSTAGGDAFNSVNRLAMSPDGGVLLAATTAGLHRSTDGGATFTLVLDTFYNPDFDRPLYVAFSPANGSKAIASAFNGKAWHSNDGGQTWIASTGLPALPGGSRRVELAYAPGNPAIVYASVDESGGAIYTSTNGGAAYSFVSRGVNYFRGPSNSQGWYDNAIWVDPTNANTLIVGGVGLFKSTNGGRTLSEITGAAHPGFHAIVSMPGYDGSTNRQVLAAHDGGVSFINDLSTAPAGWISKNNNLGVTQFYGAAGNESSGTIVGGTQANGTLRYTTLGGSQAYTSMAGGDGGFVAADPADPNYFYGESQWLSLHRSSNGGASSTTFFTKAIPDSNGNSNFIAPFILDPNNSSTLLAGGASLWRSTDAKFGAPPTFASIKAPTGSFVSAIAIASGNSDVCWVGHNNGDVYKAVDCLAASPAWTRVDDNGPGLPNRMVMRLTIDPSDPSGNRVYATFGGFTPENVWTTSNGGASWRSVSGAGAAALPAVPVHDLELHPATPSWLYAATEIGVFTSQDAGATWQVPQDAPANVIVSELFWMGPDLVAATFGRGLFKTTVDAVEIDSDAVNGAEQSDLAGADADVTPPEVTFVWPPDEATGVSLEIQVSAEFSEAIDPATLTASTFVLLNETAHTVPATVTYNDNGGVSAATLTPSAALEPGTIYKAKVTGGVGGIRDVAGNPMASDVLWSFTTVMPDPTPPTVTAVTPANGATGISTTTGVRATFSEPILSSTLTTSTFVLRSPSNAMVPATLSYNGVTSVGTLIPLSALAPFTTYTATIAGGAGGIKDRTGNPMAGNAVWSFTTTSAVITVGSTTIGTSVDTGDSNFLNGSKVTTTAAGQISSMSVYVGTIDSMVANRQYQLAVYTDNAGRPGTLVAASATGTLVADAWNTLGVSASLLGNTNYWLMFNTNGRTGAVNNMRYKSGAAAQGAYSSDSVAFGTWPSTFPSATTSNFVYSLFATSAPITVGLTAIGGFLDSGNSNAVHGSKVTMTAAAQLSSISVFVGNVDSVAANRQYQLAVYSDAGGIETRVATSAIGTLVANAWNTLPVSASLARGTDYWLVFNTNGRSASVNNMYYNSGAVGQGMSSGCCAFGTWPEFFGSMGTNFTYSLFATFGTDMTPPTLTGVTPANGATGVSTATAVTAAFSETIDAATLTTSTFALRNPGNAVVPATLSYNADTSVATLTPSAALAASTTYTATIAGGSPGVKDVAGNALASNFAWSFTTVVTDTTPPTIAGVTPANGATGVNRATAVTATFSEAINATTLTTSTFALRNPANAVVTAAVSYNAGTRVATLTPAAALAAGTTYTATVAGGSAGVKDVAGNPLASNFVWSFTTTSTIVTLGSTAIGTSIDTGDSHFMNGSKVTTTAAGHLSSMSVYVGAIDTMAANRQYQLAIYTDNAGRPGTLVAASAAGTLTANAWNTLPVSASVQASTSYWLMFNTNGRTGAVNNMRYNSGAAGQGGYSTGSVPYGTWPTTFPAATISNFVYSLFATYGP